MTICHSLKEATQAVNVLCWISSASNGGSLDAVDIPECLCHPRARAAWYDLFKSAYTFARGCSVLVGRYSDDFTPLWASSRT